MHSEMLYTPIKTTLWTVATDSTRSADQVVRLPPALAAALAQPAGTAVPFGDSLLVQLLDGCEARFTPTAATLSSTLTSTGAVSGNITSGIAIMGRNIFSAGNHVRILERVGASGVNAYVAHDLVLPHPVGQMKALYRGSEVAEALCFISTDFTSITLLPASAFEEARAEYERGLVEGNYDVTAVLTRHLTTITTDERILSAQILPRSVLGDYTVTPSVGTGTLIEAGELLLDRSPVTALALLTTDNDNAKLYHVPWSLAPVPAPAAAAAAAPAPAALVLPGPLREVSVEGEVLDGDVAFNGMAVVLTKTQLVSFNSTALFTAPSAPTATKVTIAPTGSVVAVVHAPDTIRLYTPTLAPIRPVAAPATIPLPFLPTSLFFSISLHTDPVLFVLGSGAVFALNIVLGVAAAAAACLPEDAGTAVVDAHAAALVLTAAEQSHPHLPALAHTVLTPPAAGGILCSCAGAPGARARELVDLALVLGPLAAIESTSQVFARTAAGPIVARALADGDVAAAAAAAVAPSIGTPRLAALVATYLESLGLRDAAQGVREGRGGEAVQGLIQLY